MCGKKIRKSLKGNILLGVCLYLLLILILSTSAGATTSLSLTPNSIRTDNITTVELTTNTASPGNTVWIDQFLDANQNGMIDPGEVRIFISFRLTDGVGSPVIGGITNTNVIGDEDGAADGSITTTLRFYYRPHTVGQYILRVTDEDSSISTAVLNIVDNETLAQSISGRVTDDQGVPVPGALVLVNNMAGKRIAETTTDLNGEYRVNIASPGAYVVFTFAYGYMSKWREDTSSVLVTLSPNEHKAAVNLQVFKGNRHITGTIRDVDTGAGIGGVLVYAWISSIQDIPIVATMSTVTDQNGNYDLLVIDGIWDLRVWGLEMKGYLNISEPFGQAAVSGADVTGKDGLFPSVTALITGRVEDYQGVGIPGLRVWAEDEALGYEAVAVTDPNGNYTLGVVAGDWTVGVKREDLAGSDLVSPAEQYITIADGGVESANFTAAQGGAISGNISNGQGPIENLWVMAFASQCASSSEMLGGAYTDNNGNYTIMGLAAGDYYIRTSAAMVGFNYIDEWWDDTTDCTQASAVAVTAGQTTSGVNFVLQAGGSISGKASNEEGNPISGMLLIAFSDKCWQGSSKASFTDKNGDYTILGLPPGDYYVWTYSAWSYPYLSYQDEWWDDTTDCNQASSIAVVAGQDSPNINFVLQPTGTISGRVVDQETGGILDDFTSGSINLDIGWHKFIYRQEEQWGYQASRAAFKAPGDTDWRWFSTAELDIKTSLEPDAESGILLINKKNTWDPHPENHNQLVACVDVDSTEESGWYGSSTVSIINQDENIHGNDDNYTSYYEGWFYVETAGTWYFSTDSDDASEIVVDDQVVASWYGGHSPADRWENKGGKVIIWEYDTGEWIAEADVAPDGSYKILHLPSGTYRLQAKAPGYVSEYFEETLSWDYATPVVVNAPGETSDINFTLEKSGTISGRVVDSANQPIAHLWVDVFDAGCGGNWLGGAYTDSNGVYTISGLPGGDVYVQACASCDGLYYIDEWYDNTTDCNQASPVPVTVGQTTSGIDFVLEGAVDLIVQSITTNPKTPGPGENITIEVTVKNQGLRDAGPFCTDFYKDLDSPPVPHQASDLWWCIGGLPAGATHTFNGNILYSGTGIYNLYAQVDTDEQVAECNESNNVLGPISICLSGCKGDFDCDGDVDGSDLAVFAAAFGSTCRDPNYNALADFDQDCDVDGTDLAKFAADFGRTDCL